MTKPSLYIRLFMTLVSGMVILPVSCPVVLSGCKGDERQPGFQPDVEGEAFNGDWGSPTCVGSASPYNVMYLEDTDNGRRFCLVRPARVCGMVAAGWHLILYEREADGQISQTRLEVPSQPLIYWVSDTGALSRLGDSEHLDSMEEAFFDMQYPASAGIYETRIWREIIWPKIQDYHDSRRGARTRVDREQTYAGSSSHVERVED